MASQAQSEAQQIAGRLYGELESTTEVKAAASQALLQEVAAVLNGMEQASQGRARFKADLSPDGKRLMVQLVPGERLKTAQVAIKMNGHLSISTTEMMSERAVPPLVYNALTGEWEGLDEDPGAGATPGAPRARRPALAVVVEGIASVVRADRQAESEGHLKEVEAQQHKAAERAAKAQKKTTTLGPIR